MEKKIEEYLIKELLFIKHDYPRSLFSFQSEGKFFEFFIKKGFWNQIYHRYIIECIQHLGPCGIKYGEILRNERIFLQKEDIFFSENELECLAYVESIIKNYKNNDLIIIKKYETR